MSPYQSYLRLSEGTDDLARSRPSARRLAATIGTAVLVLLATPLFLTTTALADDRPSSTFAVRDDDNSGSSEDSGSRGDGDDEGDDTTAAGAVTTTDGVTNTSGPTTTDGAGATTAPGATTTANDQQVAKSGSGQVADTREGNTRGDRFTREGNTRGGDTTVRTLEGNTRGDKNTRDEGPGQTTVDTREGNTRGAKGTHEGDTDGATTRGQTQTRTGS